MKIIETEKFKKLAQYGPRYSDPKELEGPEKDIAEEEIQLTANYAWIKAMSGMNLAEFGGFKQERIDHILADFRKDLMSGIVDPNVAKEQIAQAEALRNDPLRLMGWFKRNSPIPGSHTEFKRQKSDLDSLIEQGKYRQVQ